MDDIKWSNERDFGFVPARHGHDAGHLPSADRRSFLGTLVTLGTLGTGAVLLAPLSRFMLHPLLRDTTETAWSVVGQADELAALTAPVKKLVTIEQTDGWRKVVSEKPVYVVQDPQDGLRVLSAVCPHLGCTVLWKEAEGRFVCPCHVGIFDAAGRRTDGPPPRDMDRLESTVEDGVLKVRYQYFRQLIPKQEVMA